MAKKKTKKATTSRVTLAVLAERVDQHEARTTDSIVDVRADFKKACQALRDDTHTLQEDNKILAERVRALEVAHGKTVTKLRIVYSALVAIAGAFLTALFGA